MKYSYLHDKSPEALSLQKKKYTWFLLITSILLLSVNQYMEEEPPEMVSGELLSTRHPKFRVWKMGDDLVGSNAQSQKNSRLGKDFLANRFTIILCSGKRGWDCFFSIKDEVAHSVLLKNMASIHRTFIFHTHSTVPWLVLLSNLQVKTIQLLPVPVRNKPLGCNWSSALLSISILCCINK